MKLRTQVDESMNRGNMDDVDHDRMAAHALMMAISEFRRAPLDSSLVFPEDAINWMEQRADAIMKQWGFNSAEDA